MEFNLDLQTPPGPGIPTATNRDQELRSSLQESGKRHNTELQECFKYETSATNPGQPLASKCCLSGLLQSRGPHKVHLTAKYYPRSVV